MELPLILISALLCSLSFHPLNLHFFAWFGLLPLLFTIEKAKLSKVFLNGILFGFFFSLFSLFWIIFLQIETSVKLLMLLGMVVMFFYIGLYYGTGFLITRLIGIWYLPFILAGLEFLKGLGEIGFPWLSFGYSQARYPIIIQQASIYGVYGISFWLYLINVTLFNFLRNKNFKNLLFVLLFFFLPLGYGFIRIKDIPAGFKKITVGIVQPNIDPNLKFNAALRDETFNRLIYLSERCKEEAKDTLNLVVWPETATPVFLKTPGIYQNMVLELARRISAPVLTGTPIYNKKSQEIYNGAVLIKPEEGITQEYKKIHLVPFGEHIPFDRYIPLFKKIDLGEGDYTPGNEYTVFATDDLKFSCLICFESIFPEISRTFVKHGALLLLNITNDGWFGRISGPQQHNDMAILRTVENGVPLVRSANTGISMVVDPYGRILKETNLFEEGIIVCTIELNRINTLYRILGDWLPMFVLLFTPVLLLLKKSRLFLNVLRKRVNHQLNCRPSCL